MNLDHSEFIAKHHRSASPEPPPPEKPPVNPWIALVFVVLAVGGCVYIALSLNIQKEIAIASGVAFVVAMVVAFFLQKIVSVQSARSRDFDLLNQVFEGSRGARMVTDGADHPVYWNRKFQTLCQAEDKPGLYALAALFEEDSETMAHFRMLADQAHRGLTDSIELLSVRGQKERWFSVTAQPIAGWAGYIHWRVDDVTNRHVIDRAIREEREKLIDFTDNAPVGFFSVDEEGRFVFVNATLARWLGEDIQTILTQGRLHTYFHEVPDNVKPYDIVSGGGPKQMAEIVMKGAGGQTFAASISQAVVHEEEDSKVRTRGVVHDLTAERAMRKALKASEHRFQRFFEEAPLGIALVNADWVLEDCNPVLAAMLGQKVDSLDGMALNTLLDEEDRDAVLKALKEISTGAQTAAPFEVSLKGKENNVPVQLYARKLEDSENIVLHFIDLTQQKDLEQKFAQSQKMQAVGQLAGGVAHDFNNLLTAMIGFCDLLLLRHKPGDPSFSDIMQIKQNANRAANLVRQLLAFSRQQTLRPRVQDMTDILTEVSHLLRRLMGANIELDLVHGPDIGLVRVDTGQMEQVLVNLAVNARDAMDGGGHLTIRTDSYDNKKPVKCGEDDMPPGRWVKIAVADTGCGMSKEVMDRIFEPFFTTKEVGQGTGLGLATVYGIIRQTGGYLNVESKKDKGTTFTIYLPSLSEEEAEQEEEKIVDDTPRDLTGTARILLVEDEDAVRMFSSRALANKGYEVLEATSGENALEVLGAAEDKHIDLMVTDVIMPNMDGPTLAKKMREENPKLKIIFISGYTEEKLKDHMGENIWFLPKPFTLKQLAAKVKEAMDE
ncbi:MAG: PAS domain S-box protein [Rhodospirillales bacterium]|nr:PAS domain S-box protein [Rhodospirillales bacterium]